MLGNSIDGDYIPSNLDSSNFDTNTNWKDALISNLYSTVEFLKSKLKERNIMIHTLITVQANENYPCNRGSRIRSNTCNSSISKDSIQLTPYPEENDSFIDDIQGDLTHRNIFENVTSKTQNAKNAVS